MGSWLVDAMIPEPRVKPEVVAPAEIAGAHAGKEKGILSEAGCP
jgi:hypothetical protein